jgi:Concanavalin A-like lectin/glucanases superfamily
MKSITGKITLLVIAGITFVATIAIQSCKKTSSPPPGPTVTSVTSGASDTVGKTYTLTIAGAHLTGATVSTTAGGVTISAITATATSITGTIAIGSTATPGPVTLKVTTSAGTTTTTINVVAIPLIGGYASSDSVAAANLIAYFPFDGNANDVKGSMTPTVNGTITFTTGIRGQAYQGAAGAYATYTPSAAFASLPSYSLSVWYNLPTTDPSYGSGGQDTLTQGMFFLNGNSNWLLVNEIEPFHGDSVKVHAGLDDIASPAYQGFVPETFDTMAIGKWVHFVVTYNGGTSIYTTYQDAVPTGANDAFTNGMYLTPNPLYTDATKTTPLGNLGFGAVVPATVVVGSWPDGLFGQVAAKSTFRGQLDEMRVFNKALTQQEIAGLYLNGKAGR